MQKQPSSLGPFIQCVNLFPPVSLEVGALEMTLRLKSQVQGNFLMLGWTGAEGMVSVTQSSTAGCAVWESKESNELTPPYWGDDGAPSWKEKSPPTIGSSLGTPRPSKGQEGARPGCCPACSVTLASGWPLSWGMGAKHLQSILLFLFSQRKVCFVYKPALWK